MNAGPRPRRRRPGSHGHPESDWLTRSSLPTGRSLRGSAWSVMSLSELWSCGRVYILPGLPVALKAPPPPRCLCNFPNQTHWAHTQLFVSTRPPRIFQNCTIPGATWPLKAAAQFFLFLRRKTNEKNKYFKNQKKKKTKHSTTMFFT